MWQLASRIFCGARVRSLLQHLLKMSIFGIFKARLEMKWYFLIESVSSKIKPLLRRLEILHFSLPLFLEEIVPSRVLES